MARIVRVAWGAGKGTGEWHLPDQPVDPKDDRVWLTKCGLKFVRPGVAEALPVKRSWPRCRTCYES